MWTSTVCKNAPRNSASAFKILSHPKRKINTESLIPP